MSDEILEQQEIVSLVYNKFSDFVLIVLADGGLFTVDISSLEVRIPPLTKLMVNSG